ncbi:MAG: undecaprenyldiphospho-muramoylpentapeptide beta-N-acetylglucosaminyltransferase [Chitinophagaceae bacterium]|nr:undecaprenyldiphospho-muramoylpentapeptide beta-N-acetylglucosaminyltransferase [Chitinophagaceae bacterium]
MSRRIIIAGGGTGGHIFPALAIAGALKKMDSSIEILFVGAKGKMEMEKIPQAGYPIEGLDIAGFNRSSLIKNIGLPWKLLKSFWQVRKVLRQFKPDAVLGVGGYSSYPVLRLAQVKGIPTFLHEANSYAGRSNQLLAKKVNCVFAGVLGLDRFFPAEKVCYTGNPVRDVITQPLPSLEESRKHFKLDSTRPTLLVVGGSLGARSINEAISNGLDRLLAANIQVIWQTGKPFASQAEKVCSGKQGVWTGAFIQQMEMAYAASTLIVARAGAMTVAEIAVVAKPAIFVPFPHAAEDHQTANAMQLVKRQAGLLITDHEAATQLVSAVIELCSDEEKRKQMTEQIRPLGIRDAGQRVAVELLKRIKA